jgi:hypothetical protein
VRRALLLALLLSGCAASPVSYSPPPGVPQSAVASELEGCEDDARLIYDSDERERFVGNCMSSRGFTSHTAKR